MFKSDNLIIVCNYLDTLMDIGTDKTTSIK